MNYIEKNSEKIIDKFFKSGIIYIISYILNFLAKSSTSISITGHYIAITLLIIAEILKIIAIIWIFKATCSTLYKLLKLIDQKLI